MSPALSIHQKLPQVLKFPPGISFIERNNDFSFKFPYVWDSMIATLYAPLLSGLSPLSNEELNMQKILSIGLILYKQWQHMESNESKTLNSFACSFSK